MKRVILIVSIISLVIFYSCEKDNIESDKKRKITNKDQAEDAAWAVVSSFKGVAPMQSLKSFSNQKINSSISSGYAIVTGVVEKKYIAIRYSSESYKNLSIQFFKYQENGTDPLINGTATINGTIYYKSGSNEGSWTLTASSVEFSGSIEDKASVSVIFSSSINWRATVSCSSGTYNVDSSIKK